MFFARMLQLTVFVLQLLLSMFFLFVGAMKTLAPMQMLQLHHAWVADLPEPIARAVGVSELLCAATMMFALVIRPLAWWSGVAALSLVANQAVAVAFHALRGELGISGLQNGILILALVFIFSHRCIAGDSNAATQQK